MKKVSKTINLLAALCCSALSLGYANAAAVYKVSKDSSEVYIGGTIHVLTQEDFPLAPAYEQAYEKADELYFETDIAAFQTVEVQQKVVPVIMQAPGSKLSDQLSEQTMKDLTQFLIDRQLPIVQFDAMSATGVMLTLTMMEFQAKGFTSEGVDAFFHKKGLGDGKAVGWLESVDSQIGLLDSFDDGDPDALIAYTLADMDNSSEAIDSIHGAWKSGDLDALEQAALTEMKNDYPQIYQDVMVTRNNNWMPQIEAMFEDDDTEYVLVGALHLAGEDGVLKMLEDKGYKVEKL